MSKLGPRAEARRWARVLAAETLPRSVYRNHGALYFVCTDPTTGNQKAHRLGRTWSEAKPKWERLVRQHRTADYALKHVYNEEGGGPIPVVFLGEMLRNAKKNAKLSGRECTLTIEEMKSLAERTAGRCELTKIEFVYGPAKELAGSGFRRKRLWAPSLDRIDGAVGYVVGNVRIVCMAVNIARQEFGDEVLFKIAAALIATKHGRSISSVSAPQTKAARAVKSGAIPGIANEDSRIGADI